MDSISEGFEDSLVIESSASELSRVSLEDGLNKDLAYKYRNNNNNNNNNNSSNYKATRNKPVESLMDRFLSSSDESDSFTSGERYASAAADISSLLGSDNSISAAAEELDAALNDASEMSIEIGRGFQESVSSPQDRRPLGSARRVVSATTPLSSSKTRKSTAPLGERPVSELNRPRSPAQSRFASSAKKSQQQQPQPRRSMSLATATEEVPKSFKSTQDLLMQLGLREDSPRRKSTSRSKNPPLSSSAGFGNGATAKSRSVSMPGSIKQFTADDDETANVLLPDLTGITSLISDATTEVRKDTHRKIGSVPISDDDQAILNALRTMQDRIQQLETKNATYKTAVATLDSDLRRTKSDYETAQSRVATLERELERQRREVAGGISPAGREKIQRALERERQEWMQKQTQLKDRVEELEREISFQNIRCQRLEEERDEAVKSLTKEVERNGRLKQMNTELREQLKVKKSKDQKSGKAAKTTVVASEDSWSTEESDVVEPGKRATRKKVRRPSTKRQPARVVVKSDTESFADYDDEESVSDTDSIDEDVDEYDDDLASETEQVPARRSKRASHRPAAAAAAQRHRHRPAREKAERIPRPTAEMKKVMDTLNAHNPTSCTVCTRHRVRLNHGTAGAYMPARPSAFDSRPSAPVPDTAARADNSGADGQWQEEHTMRPSMPADEAAARVLSQLEDEFRHLKIRYQTEVSEYERLDAAVGKRRRKAVVARLRATVDALENKADQIYAMYDVLEANMATDAYRMGKFGGGGGGVSAGGVQSEGIWSSALPRRV
ncbi:centrosome microtubule-binding domain of Cep57-domain-containing protein [Myxozyma melibiosi]|uniref:Centrosome microtubule-binding domain of Cep57-domain-containing protein n=1 Tax=Myxozyma melibiosi TaxID=54550 RepID=A0ABR1FAZ8_9ASCO